MVIPATIVGYFWNVKFGAKIQHEQPVFKIKNDYIANLPNPFFSVIPIFIPILLIATKSIISAFASDSNISKAGLINFLGDPIIALIVGLFLCAPLLKKLKKPEINHILDDSIEKAGPILAIIAAGGAFGEIIKGLDLGKVYGGSLGDFGLGLMAPFILAAIFKTAQGSSTVAAISTASIILPLMSSLGLDSESGHLLTLASIGAGSMFFSHANDAYFWVITRFSQIDPKETYKLYSTASAIMSITTLACVFIYKFLTE